MSNCKIVISRTSSQDPKRQEVEEALAEKCAAHGLETLLIPDVYHLAPGAASLSALCKIRKPIIFFSWYWPRASFWTLQKLGVKGSRVVSLGKASRPKDKRQIICFNLSDKCCPDRWFEQVVELLGGKRPRGTASIDRLEEIAGERWYPVLDYERCNNCQQCLEFCLFGVFDMDAEGCVNVSTPNACKPGCPACSRVCPSQAIMFPLYDSDPAIAGSDDGEIKPFTPDSALVEKLKKQYKEGKLDIDEVVKACGCNARSLRAASEDDGSAPRGEKDQDQGYFDGLIDRLVKD